MSREAITIRVPAWVAVALLGLLGLSVLFDALRLVAWWCTP